MIKVDFVIKLGGSAITHKDTPMSANMGVIESLGMDLSGFDTSSRKIILVHGGGSFGHPAAGKYIEGGRVVNPGGIAEIRGAMLSLTDTLTEAFLRHGVPAFVINPSACFVLDGGRLDPARSFLLAVECAMASGLIPVMCGDVVFDSRGGASILSGDSVARFLALKYDAGLLAFGTDVDGVLKGNEIIDMIRKDEIDSVRSLLAERKGDVTGGMSGKLKEIGDYLAEGGRQCMIFNVTRPGMLRRLLSYERVEGTYIG